MTIPAKLLVAIREAIRTGNVAVLAAVLAEIEAGALTAE